MSLAIFPVASAAVAQLLTTVVAPKGKPPRNRTAVATADAVLVPEAR